jgi:hypothetical protein
MFVQYFRNAIWLAQTFDTVQRFWKLESIAKKNLANVCYIILTLLLSTYFVRGVWNCEQGPTLMVESTFTTLLCFKHSATV